MRELRIKMLPPQMTKRNFIHGEEELCNYELYITDFLNSSKVLMKKFNAPFVYQEKQSKGEPDAISGCYGIDYKMIASQTSQKANSVTSDQIWKHENGMVSYGSPKTTEPITAYYLHVALRGLGCKEIGTILEKETKNPIEEDICSYINSIMKNKNLLLFFPYQFFSSPEYKYHKYGISNMIGGLEDSFVSSLLYRKSHIEKETFLASIYNDDFVITQLIDNRLVYIDRIGVFESTTYKKLLYYDPWYGIKKHKQKKR